MASQIGVGDNAMTIRFLGALFLCLALPLGVRAEDKPAADQHAAPAAELKLPAHVETHHVLQLGDKSLAYTAVAETIPLTDSKGETTASIFTTAYLADGAPAGSRPLAFVFNGGPGAASVYLHLGALGPQVLETPGNGAPPSPPVRLIDNPNSWLAFTDLVFVDPVGTGFSRGKGKDDNPDKPFWNVNSDLSSLAQLTRLWLTRHERWASPVYLVGESYGGFRAAALAKSLAEDVGITVSGLVLVSPALNTAILHPDVSNLMPAAFELPSYAATAAALAGKAPGSVDLAAAERFALGDYLTGLAQLPTQPSAGDQFLARVSALIGMPEDTVQRERGRVSSEAFTHELRKKQHEILSLYDATVTRPTTANPWDDHAGDAILDGATAAYTAAFDIYAPQALGYRTDLQYRALHHQTAQQWDWNSGRGGGLGLALSSLQSALLAHPQTRVLIAHGRYDLVTPYLASRWLVDQLSLPDAVRKSITTRVYEGGHMMYMRPRSRAALAADAAALFAGRDAAASE
jgi:carboxypeptidase C (cathepsin A)